MLKSQPAEEGRGERVLGLVKDGVMWDAYRSADGRLTLVEGESRDHIPVTCETVSGIGVARVACGDNCYVFDSQILRSTLRKVLAFARRGSGAFLLDLSGVSLVADSHLQALRSLADELRGRGRTFGLLAPATVVAREALAAVPELMGFVFSREKDGIARLQAAAAGRASDSMT